MTTKIQVSVLEIGKIIGEKVDEITKYFINKGLDILDVDINDKEKDFLDKNPYPSVGWAFCALGAVLLTERMNGTLDGEGDAMRHCLWGACMTQTLGKETATTMLANHEFGQSNKYDKHNNEVAVKIGTDNINIWEACQNAAKDGSLQYDGSPKPNAGNQNKPGPQNKPKKPVIQNNKPKKPNKPQKPNNPGKPNKPGKPTRNNDRDGGRNDTGIGGDRGPHGGGNHGGGNQGGGNQGGGNQGGGNQGGGNQGGGLLGGGLA